MQVTENKGMSLTINDISTEEWDHLVFAGIRGLVNNAKTDDNYVLVTPNDPLWETINTDTNAKRNTIEIDDEDSGYLAQIGVVEILKDYLKENT